MSKDNSYENLEELSNDLKSLSYSLSKSQIIQDEIKTSDNTIQEPATNNWLKNIKQHFSDFCVNLKSNLDIKRCKSFLSVLCVWCSPSNEKGAKRKCPRCKKILEDLKQLIKISYIATHEHATKRKIAEYVEYEIKQLNLEMSKITYENLLKIYRKNNGFESVEIEIDKFDFFLLENELKKYKEKEKSGSLINKGEKIYLFILELVHAMYKKEEEKEEDDEEEKSVSIENIDEDSSLWLPEIMLEVYKKKEKCLLDFCKEIKLKEDYFDNFDYRELEELKKSDKMKQYYRLCRSLSQTISSVFSTKWTNL